MKLAIIGATGMLGQHALHAALAAGHQVRVTYRSPESLKKLSIQPTEQVKADLSDVTSLTEAMRGCDAVINAAGYYPTIPRKWQEDVAHARAEQQRFIDAVEKSGIAKAIYLGGAIALPKRTDGKIADGTERYAGEPEDKNPYLQAKWAMDEMALQAAERGVPMLIAIPSMTLGEYDFGPTTGQIIKGIADQSLPKYVAGKRNVVYAGDAGRGLVLAAERGEPGKRYLLTGTNTDMKELCELAARIAKVPAPKEVPLGAAKFLNKLQTLRWRLGGAVPKISETAIAVMSSGQHLDGHIAKEKLGYAPTVSLEETVRKTLTWMASQNMVPK
ncbi:MAG: NAD-dependent epimerase/dehydratase family protein [Casimicrobium sp.]